MDLTAAIIGCGSISRFHFAALEKMGVRIAWINDLSEEAARPWVARTGARFTPDIAPILSDPAVQVVHVLVGSPHHAALCRQILPTRKALICEKTLTTSADESLALVRLARQHRTLFYTGYMKRFLPAVQKAKELLPSIGPVISCHARVHQVWGRQWGPPLTDGFFGKGPDGASRVFRNNGGGILVCGGSHVIDLLLHLVGRPTRIYGEVHVRPERDYDVRATALMTTPDGVVHFEALGSPHARTGFQRNGWDETIELIGTEGVLRIFSPQWDATASLPSLLQHYDNATGTQTDHRFAPAGAFDAELAAIYRNIADGRQGEPADLTGYETDEVLDAIMASSRAGQAVDVNWRVER
jgi:predicted dehydrogenase